MPFLAFCPLDAMYKNKKHPIGVKHPKSFYINEGEKLYWAWRKEDMEAFWKKLRSAVGNQYRMEKHFSNLDGMIKQGLVMALKVKRMNLKSKGNDFLSSLMEEMIKKFIPAHLVMNSEIDVIDLYFEEYLREKLVSVLRKSVPKNVIPEVYEQLVSQVKPTYINKMEIDVLKAAIKHDFSFGTSERLFKKYWWTNLGWENMNPLRQSYFPKHIRIEAKKPDLAHRLRKVSGFIKINTSKRQRITKKYKLGKEVEKWLWVYDKYVFYHDRRKEFQVKTSYALYLILLEAARRFHLSKDDLVWLWPTELIGLFRGKKIDFNEVNRRKIAVSAEVCFDMFVVSSGRKAAELRKKLSPDVTYKLETIKGVGVINMRAKGKVRRCSGYKEALAKLRRGEILVCPMTTPDYVPAMKRAAAIITDEGGITCHAAVIARELGIPCIVGTRIATQALVNNDVVEVDASKGIVRLIKRC